MSELAASWSNAKDVFEKATGKKKPSESVLGFFSKGSGVGDALKKADKGWDDAKKFTAAAADFRKKASAYKKTLKAAMEKDDKGHPAIKSLVVELDLIGAEIDRREVELTQAAEAAENKKKFDAAVAKQLSAYTLEKIRADRAMLDAFRSFLKAEFSTENLKFLDAIDASKPKRLIYDTYIAGTAQWQVNLPAKMKTEADEAATAGTLDDLDLKPAYKEIVALINKDSKRRFLASAVAKEAMEKRLAKKFGIEA